ncbi:hypothetical protein M885DRAFT_225350 [Pelagophyceae sp. CCMP2097]|nr:hypothetical protein M885DRAFT_225350 [Pelagophyceae sp. CCMP2097]
MGVPGLLAMALLLRQGALAAGPACVETRRVSVTGTASDTFGVGGEDNPYADGTDICWVLQSAVCAHPDCKPWTREGPGRSVSCRTRTRRTRLWRSNSSTRSSTTTTSPSTRARAPPRRRSALNSRARWSSRL